ncbi:type VII secretion-associated serine protease mycosin [Streptomyces sp. NPDC051322]|uniref:type VII secretion-associated serine protease mycosin n=1 Tax=Streptomyces sp. NPDC051322 TaxID=3154645 RepID=UPI003450D757
MRRRGPIALASAMAAAACAVLPAVPAHADSIRAQEWALESMHAPQAWRTTQGKGVTVAVLDTGVDNTNPDLAGQVLTGKDFIGFGARRGDRSWARHGTAMAGIIAGHGHGPGHEDGIMGIAPEARILPVRVILEGSDPAIKKAHASRGDALADGIRWAADHGADVINLSLGDDSASAHPEPTQDSAIQYALAKGVVVVVSAGNKGEDGDPVSYPAAYPGVIAVTAVDRYGTHASFSTRHWYATVSAPGDDVVIADPDHKYYLGWGTSAASAFVSGAVALVRAAYPDLTPVQIRKLLTDTARNAPQGGRDDARGYGIVDTAAALKAAAKLTPANVRTEATAYGQKYFGPGPDARSGSGGPAGWLVPLAGATGVLVLVGGAVLWRGGRSAGTTGGRGAGFSRYRRAL